MGKKKRLEHQPNKFEQHLDSLSKKKVKQQVRAQVDKKRAIQEAAVVNKKNLFQLDSDEEVQAHLTHNGQPLNDDYIDNEILSSGDELPKGFVKSNHFVGFEKQPENQKSKKEIYSEMIANSKKRKLEKQRQKEENVEKIQELNDALPELFSVLPFRTKPPPALDDEYALLAETFKHEPKIQVEAAPPKAEKDQKTTMRQKRLELKRQKQETMKQQLQQDSSDEEEKQNDDCVSKQIKSVREKKMLKSYRKVEKLQKVMEHFRRVQNYKKIKRVKVEGGENDEEIDDDEALKEILEDEDFDEEDDDQEDDDSEEEDDDGSDEEGEEDDDNDDGSSGAEEEEGESDAEEEEEEESQSKGS